MTTGMQIDGGRFRIRGSLGDVRRPYAQEAVDLESEESFALTKLSSDLDQRARDFVTGELLGHSCSAVPEFSRAVQTDDGEVFLVGELVRSPPLSMLLRRGRALPLAEVRTIGTQLLHALAAIHPRHQGFLMSEGTPVSPADIADGFVHTRIRPEHVLWNGEEITLVGLGHARPMGPPSELFTMVSDDYDPPDMAELGVHPSIDLYAAGVLVHRLLTTEDAFDETHTDLDKPLRAFFHRALAHRGPQRFPTSEEMAAGWSEATEVSRELRIPSEWFDLERDVEEAAVRVGAEIPPAATSLQIGKVLIDYGFDTSDYATFKVLYEIRHDIRGETVRFKEMAESVRSVLDDLESDN